MGILLGPLYIATLEKEPPPVLSFFLFPPPFTSAKRVSHLENMKQLT